jgi:hypothetical protein
MHEYCPFCGRFPGSTVATDVDENPYLGMSAGDLSHHYNLLSKAISNKKATLANEAGLLPTIKD